jgi:hypothetical protein
MALRENGSPLLVFFSSVSSGPARRMDSLVAQIARKERRYLGPIPLGLQARSGRPAVPVTAQTIRRTASAPSRPVRPLELVSKRSTPPPGRARRRDTASSVAPVASLRALPASLSRIHRSHPVDGSSFRDEFLASTAQPLRPRIPNGIGPYAWRRSISTSVRTWPIASGFTLRRL